MQSAPDMETGHWFGTDSLGATCSCVPCSADASPDGRHHGALVAVIIGTLYGAASGFIGGRVDSLMMRVLEILNASPSCSS